MGMISSFLRWFGRRPSQPDDPPGPAATLILHDTAGDSSSTSWIGGQPQVPAGFEWPVYNGRPLDFLLQLDLAVLAAFETGLNLPKAGRLLFFYDTEIQTWGFRPEDRGSSAVIYLTESDKLQLASGPDGTRIFGQMPVTFAQTRTSPDSRSPWASKPPTTTDHSGSDDAGPDMNGQIGGYPHVVQNSMELQCELVCSGLTATPAAYHSLAAMRAGREVRNWRLLAQIPSIEALNLMWGDGGMLYFWIKQDALQRREFSRSWLILQSY